MTTHALDRDWQNEGVGPQDLVAATLSDPLTPDDHHLVAALMGTHVLDGIDDDVTQDLAAMGIALAPNVEAEMDDERRHAMAAVLLRRAGGVGREIEQIEGTMSLELEAIRAHYERQLMPLRTRRQVFLDFVANLAGLVQWKKKKSAATPYGSFGVKDRAASVRLADAAAALTWARTNQPDVVRVVVTLPLADAYQYFTDDELAATGKVELEWGKLKAALDAAGALPPGVERVEPVRETFAEAVVLDLPQPPLSRRG
jgi:phage host-nuclease inhibitor protein Gam